MRISAAIPTSIFFLSALTTCAAQAPITAVTLGPDQIGVVKTAVGLSTRIVFTGPVREIICGDLYDAGAGRGTFVVQKGENDVFIKPVAPKGMSNLFVKIGENDRQIFNFDLKVVPVAEAHRVVNVSSPRSATPTSERSASGGDTAGDGSRKTASREIEQLKAKAQQEADDAIRAANQQAARITAEAEARAVEVDRKTLERSEQEIERRFVRALMTGLREAKINNPRVAAKKVIISLDPRVITLDDKSYLRYTILNNGDADFVFSSITLEAGVGSEIKAVTSEVTQNKSENKVSPKEAVAGIIVFDAKQVGARDKLALFIRGEENAEIAHLNIQ